MDIEKLKEMYQELLPWEKVDFCDWISCQDEFELDYEDIDYSGIPLAEIAGKYNENELLDQCDSGSIVDYVFDHGLEDMVVDQYNEEALAAYLEKACPSVINQIVNDEITDKERDRIFDVAYSQGFRDGRNGKKNKCE